MGDLKPLGSEKLQGMDKIQRILEIAKFNEKVPSSVKETSKTEYSLQLADGNTYQIVREKAGYIIKQSISESEVDYIAPIQDRKYYDSYSQALKRLNLMAKEMNELYENQEGTSLFSEQKKFVLKTPQKKSPSPAEEVENVPPPPAPVPSEPASPPAPSAEAPPPPPSDEMGDTAPPPPMDDDSMESPESADMAIDQESDEHVTWKTIQKITGKLGQKLRKYTSNEENEITSNDVKYVINSVLSALDLSLLDDEDREEIMSKFDLETSDEEFSEPSDDMGSEEPEMTPDEEPSEVPSPEGEATEELGEDEDLGHIRTIADNIFRESKVENILMKYFDISEDEKKLNEQKEKNKRKVNFFKSQIEKLSETSQQKLRAKKFLNENSSANLVGITNKNNLIFRIGEKEFKITPKGTIQ